MRPRDHRVTECGWNPQLQRGDSGRGAQFGLQRRPRVLPEREQLGVGIQDHAEQCGHKFNQWDRRARSEIQQQRGEESGCCAASGIVPTMSNAGLKRPRQSCWAPLVSGSKHDRGVHNEFGDFRAIA